MKLGRAGTLPISCDDPSELTDGLDYVQKVCTQTGESFSSPYNPIPISCTSSACKVAVGRVSRDCGPLLSGDSWFAATKGFLDAAVTACAPTPAPATTNSLDHSSPPYIVSCTGELSGRAGGSGSNYDQEATIDAGPSGGKASLNFGTLVLADGDILTAYDGPKCDIDTPWLAQLRGTAIPAAPLVSSGRFMCVKLVTNKQSAASSFSAEVSCRCQDSVKWSATARNCTAFAQGAPGSLFETCEKQAGQALATGTIVPDSRGIIRTLDAKEACPLACGACDACSSFPCQNGGTCTATGTAHLQKGTCATAEMGSSTAAINAQCCGADDADCAGGLPTSCDAGCAATFLPFWASCGSAMQGAADYSGVVALCEARIAAEQGTAYQCACEAGWSGVNCDHSTGCDSSPCGAHGSCVAQGAEHTCTCEAGYLGEHCASSFTVSGCQLASLNGVFIKTTHVCNGKPTYQKDDNGVLFLPNGSPHWAIGPTQDAVDCQIKGKVLDRGSCEASPDGAGCVGKWIEAERVGWNTRPNLKVVATAQ
jgi:hypothetical protein